METNVEVSYKRKNKIYLKVGSKESLVISDDKKEITAAEIYELFAYKKDKKYVLKPLEDTLGISNDYLDYLKKFYKMIDGIIKDIS
ncbi:MAG: hypothetical protein PHG18_03790 [Bacilli bacterium]|nr:hypothetical protein [Bacilli bacterium]